MIELGQNEALAKAAAGRLERLKSGSDLVDGLNAAAVVGRAFVVERVTEHLNLPQDYVDKLFTIKRASAGSLEARIVGRRRAVQLREFGARQEWAKSKHGKTIRGGVSVQVLRDGQRKTIRSAFFIPLRGGNGFGVAQRVGKPRLPIRVLYGPEPAAVMAKITPETLEVATDGMRQFLLRRMSGFLGHAEGDAA